MEAIFAQCVLLLLNYEHQMRQVMVKVGFCGFLSPLSKWNNHLKTTFYIYLDYPHEYEIEYIELIYIVWNGEVQQNKS